MFTGIIADIGVMQSVTRTKDTRMVISTSFDLEEVAIGASIACSGVCLTVVEKQDNNFAVDVSDESLACSTLSLWQQGTKVNLERAMQVGDEFGGHYVSGHVDGMATLLDCKPVQGSHQLTFEAPEQLKQFIAPKGSVTLDGVSLTVNDVADRNFTINIIPHTWENTTLGALESGDDVNVEVDMLARYVQRMMKA